MRANTATRRTARQRQQLTSRLDGPQRYSRGVTVELRGTVLAVSAGKAQTLMHGRRAIESAFVKTAITDRIEVTELGIPGDEHVYEDHGGPDMALLAYPVEHYAYWRSLGLELPGQRGARREPHHHGADRGRRAHR